MGRLKRFLEISVDRILSSTGTQSSGATLDSGSRTPFGAPFESRPVHCWSLLLLQGGNGTPLSPKEQHSREPCPGTAAIAGAPAVISASSTRPTCHQALSLVGSMWATRCRRDRLSAVAAAQPSPLAAEPLPVRWLPRHTGLHRCRHSQYLGIFDLPSFQTGLLWEVLVPIPATAPRHTV